MGAWGMWTLQIFSIFNIIVLGIIHSYAFGISGPVYGAVQGGVRHGDIWIEDVLLKMRHSLSKAAKVVDFLLGVEIDKMDWGRSYRIPAIQKHTPMAGYVYLGPTWIPLVLLWLSCGIANFINATIFYFRE